MKNLALKEVKKKKISFLLLDLLHPTFVTMPAAFVRDSNFANECFPSEFRPAFLSGILIRSEDDVIID